MITSGAVCAQTQDLHTTGEFAEWQSGKVLDAGNFTSFFSGHMHRDLWSQSIPVPVLDLASPGSYYTMIDRGGSEDTLFIAGAEGATYALLPIDFDGSFPTPEIMPYGMMLASEFAALGGVAYAANGWVKVPDHADLLGRFRGAFGNSVVRMQREVPDDGWSSRELIDKLKNDPATVVDARSYLRIRLLELWMGDWQQDDAHLYWYNKEGSCTPVVRNWRTPFFALDGMLPWIVRHRWNFREWQDFKGKIRDIPGLVLSSKPLDERILVGLSREDWLQEVRELRDLLTNEQIARIVNLMPERVSREYRNNLTNQLELRKYALEEAAMTFYALLAENVDVVGSNHPDYFTVQRLSNGAVEVRRFDDAGGIQYLRVFTPEDTREVRIFGLDGDDRMEIGGATNNAMKVRLAGGEGADEITDQTGKNSLFKPTVIYDTEFGNTIRPGRNARVDYSLNNSIARYDPVLNKYPLVRPRIHVGYNTDDKLYLGGELRFTKYGFSRMPYASQQRLQILGSVARSTIEAGYLGDFTNVFGPFGFRAEAVIQLPHYTTFYGIGNKTVYSDPESAQVELKNIELFAGLTARFKHGHVYAGPAFQWADPEVVTCPDENADLCADATFVGGRMGFEIRTLDDEFFPENGIFWDNRITFLVDIDDNARFARLNSALTGYYTFLAGIQFTLAGRIGAGTNMGEFPFYQAQVLGGGTGYYRGGTIRGYVRDRFRGTSLVYQNLELRAQLFSIPAYRSSILVGLSIHTDNGRVWSEADDGSTWHNAFGGGLFIRPEGMSSITVTYTSSDERDLVTVGLGFFF